MDIHPKQKNALLSKPFHHVHTPSPRRWLHAGGIVFYANYLKFFERARTEWLRARGVSQQHLRQTQGGMFVVSATELRHHRPARLDDLLLVTALVSEAGRASLTIGQSARLAEPGGPLLCEGRIRIGWVDAATLSPRRMPEALRQALALQP